MAPATKRKANQLDAGDTDENKVRKTRKQLIPFCKYIVSIAENPSITNIALNNSLTSSHPNR